MCENLMTIRTVFLQSYVADRLCGTHFFFLVIDSADRNKAWAITSINYYKMFKKVDFVRLMIVKV